MRIVGGKYAGRDLTSPNDFRVRPTAEHVRAALLDILAPDLRDASVLDLFAGTGALGLEALSRGAAFVLFVDDGAEARALLRANIDALGAGGATKVYRRDATRLGPVHPMQPFALAFLAPTYGQGLAERALVSARGGGWLTPEALIVVEEVTEAKFAPPEGFQELERRDYGDTQLIFLRAEAGSNQST